MFSTGGDAREACIKVDVEDWMLSVFTIEEDGFTAVFTTGV